MQQFNINREHLEESKIREQRTEEDASKLFKLRKSLLDEWHESGCLPIYHYIIPIMFVKTAIFMCLHCYFINKSVLERTFSIMLLIIQQTEKSYVTGLLCFLMIAAVLLIYFPCFLMWSYFRMLLLKKGYFDLFAVTLHIIFNVLLATLSIRYTFIYDIPLAQKSSTWFVTFVLLLKTYSFTRENVPKVLKWGKLEKDHMESNCWRPNFAKFCYFLSAPTFIYCDSYPRTNYIRWKYLFYYVFCTLSSQILLVTSILSLVIDVFERCASPLTFTGIAIYVLVGYTFAAFTAGVVLQYGIFHSFYNAWAEATCFGDREFYSDWWYSTSSSDFIRKWGIPIHSWLRRYIYADCCNILLLRKRTAAFVTLFVSAFFHDCLLNLSLQLCLPISCIFVTVYAGPVLQRSKPKDENSSRHKSKKRFGYREFILLIIILCSIGSLLAAEICARIKCSPSHVHTLQDTWITFYRLFSC